MMLKVLLRLFIPIGAFLLGEELDKLLFDLVDKEVYCFIDLGDRDLELELRVRE